MSSLPYRRSSILVPLLLIIGCSNPASLPVPPSTSSGAQVSGERKSEDQPIVLVTSKAAKTITQIIQDQAQGKNYYLRMRVEPGGCMGFKHKLDIDPEVSPSIDHTFESNGIHVVIAHRQIEMLRGAQVDFVDEGEQRGFTIKNSNFEGESLRKWLAVLNAEAPPAAKRPPEELSKSIAEFRRMASEDPTNELAHFRFGQLLMEDEKYLDAVKALERTIELSPRFCRAYQLLGECLIKVSQKDRAAEVLFKGIEVAEKRNDEKARNAMVELLTDIGIGVPLESAKKKAKE